MRNGAGRRTSQKAKKPKSQKALLLEVLEGEATDITKLDLKAFRLRVESWERFTLLNRRSYK